MDADNADHWVVCIEHSSGPYTKAQAAERLVQVARDPYACPRDHHVVQSATEPEPSYPPAGPNPLPATS